MSKALTKKEEDFLRMVAAKCHIGTTNLNNSMKKYTTHKNKEGVHFINLEETYQKILLAARIIVAVENPQDVIAISARPYGQRAVIKFANYTGVQTPSSSRWTPGLLTNQNTKLFTEPRLMVVTDPRSDRQAIIEASYANIPVIALCDTDSDLEYVDVAIPCGNRSTESISLIYWMIAREVKYLRGELSRSEEWDVMVDLFFYKTIEDLKEHDKNEEGEFARDAEDKKNWDAVQQGATETAGADDGWEA